MKQCRTIWFRVRQLKPFGCEIRSLVALALMLFVASASAQENRFKLVLGSYLVDSFDTSVSVTEESAGIGVLIDPAKTLNLETEDTVFRFEGHYRFTDEHMIHFGWYQIKSDGRVALQEEIDWVDENGDAITIPIGAEVNTTLQYDIYKLGYMWSFYHTEKVELRVGAGLHVTQLKLGLTADVTSSGVSAEKVDTTLPLPVLSVGLTYNITPKLNWYFKTEALALSFEDWDGTYVDSELGMEYSMFKHFGVGVGLGTNSLKIEEDSEDYQLHFENRITGLMVYVAGNF